MQPRGQLARRTPRNRAGSSRHLLEVERQPDLPAFTTASTSCLHQVLPRVAGLCSIADISGTCQMVPSELFSSGMMGISIPSDFIQAASLGSLSTSSRPSAEMACNCSGISKVDVAVVQLQTRRGCWGPSSRKSRCATDRSRPAPGRRAATAAARDLATPRDRRLRFLWRGGTACSPAWTAGQEHLRQVHTLDDGNEEHNQNEREQRARNFEHPARASPAAALFVVENGLALHSCCSFQATARIGRVNYRPGTRLPIDSTRAAAHSHRPLRCALHAILAAAAWAGAAAFSGAAFPC